MVVEPDVVEEGEWVEEWVRVEGRGRVEEWGKAKGRVRVKARVEWEEIAPAPVLAADVCARAVVR